MSEENFLVVSKLMSQNREKHEKQIKDFCATTELCSFQEFLRGYEEEAKVIENSNDDILEPCSITSFKDTFQIFDKYPPNLQKPKKQFPKDLNRTLSINRIHSASDSAIDKVSSAEKWGKGPDATNIYSNYRKFRKILNQLQEAPQNGLELKYLDALQKINSLAKNIEKLQGDQFQNADIAFSAEDAVMLNQFVSNFEKALYVDENQNLFKDFYQNEQSMQNVSNVMELLDYCFEKIGHLPEK